MSDDPFDVLSDHARAKLRVRSQPAWTERLLATLPANEPSGDGQEEGRSPPRRRGPFREAVPRSEPEGGPESDFGPRMRFDVARGFVDSAKIEIAHRQALRSMPTRTQFSSFS